MARAIAIRAIGDRSAGLRAANKRAATRPESGIAVITALSASLAITSGGGLPTADTAELTITFDGVLPAGADFAVGGFTLYAANRVWVFDSGVGSKSTNTLTISGLAADDTIIGNGNLTVGTPTAYATTDNKLTYDGSDSTNLAGVASISNLSVTLTGDAVPVACKLQANAGAWDTTIIFSANIDAFDDVPDMTGVATGLTLNAGANLVAAGGTNTATISSQPNSTSVFTGTSGLSDRWIEGATGLTSSSVSVPAFTFPLYIVGGALAVPVSAAFNGVNESVAITMSRSLTVAPADGTGFSGRYSNQTLNNDSDCTIDGTLLTWLSVLGAANPGIAYVSRDGTDGALDDQSRPVPPWSNLPIS